MDRWRFLDTNEEIYKDSWMNPYDYCRQYSLFEPDEDPESVSESSVYRKMLHHLLERKRIVDNKVIKDLGEFILKSMSSEKGDSHE